MNYFQQDARLFTKCVGPPGRSTLSFFSQTPGEGLAITRHVRVLKYCCSQLKLWRPGVAPAEDPELGAQESALKGELSEVSPRQLD